MTRPSLAAVLWGMMKAFFLQSLKQSSSSGGMDSNSSSLSWPLCLMVLFEEAKPPIFSAVRHSGICEQATFKRHMPCRDFRLLVVSQPGSESREARQRYGWETPGMSLFWGGVDGRVTRAAVAKRYFSIDSRRLRACCSHHRVQIGGQD